jgi:hypothetical protein
LANPLEYVNAHFKETKRLLGISYHNLQQFIGQAKKAPSYPDSKGTIQNQTDC